MIESIEIDGKVLAMILRSSYREAGIKFFTPDDYSQQIAYMNRPQGYEIAPHVHNEVRREVFLTKEVVFVKSGRVRVDFYTEQQAYLESNVLSAGDVILLAYGGHGFLVLEDSEMIEVKQGPYAGEADKTRFTPVDPARIKMREPPS